VQNLRAIDYHLGVADRKVRLLARLTPVNASQERRKFLYAYARERVYNPFFRYKKSSMNLGRLAAKLSSLSIGTPAPKTEEWFFARHLQKRRKRILEKIRAIEHIGSCAFALHARRLFGKPSREQIREAQTHLHPASAISFLHSKDSLSTNGAAKILQKRIDRHALPWRVKLRSSISSKAGLDARSKYLLIKTGERFAPEEVESLAVHEVETHIFRKENGALQRFPNLFGGGFAGPPTTEEGLAFFTETQYRTYDTRRVLIVAARTIAANLAYSKSFYEIFRVLVHYGLPCEYAWAATLRIKRGFSDTSQPGAFPKDHHYLKGYLAIKKYAKQGGDLRALYIGKLNLDTIRPLAKLNIQIRDPRYLPRYLQ